MSHRHVGACCECGNDDPCEGYRYCSDCLDLLGHAADPAPRSTRH